MRPGGKLRLIMHLTKVTDSPTSKPVSPAPAAEAGAPEDRELIRQVAYMLGEWEDSDELATEFARRLVAHIRENLSSKS